MDYFDDDELINDYMEDSVEHPPQEAQEDFPEDFMDKARVHETQNNSPEGAYSPTQTALPNILAPIGAHESSTGNLATSGPPPTESDLSVLSRRPDHDIYSFERYSTSSEWRKPRNDEAFEARHWKTATTSTGSFAGKSHGRCDTSTSSGPLLSSPIWKELGPLHIDLNSRNSVVTTKRHGVTKFPTEGQGSVSMTVSGGTRVHVATNHLVIPQQQHASSAANIKNGSHHLLGVSMATLIIRSDKIAMKQNQARRNAPPERHLTNDSQLWVDKHAPSAFSHLLSDDQTNRNVLRALRAWDPYVFQKDAPKPRFTPKEHLEQNSNPRDIRPPESQRVLLLSGPPGVGKTTLAHIVARHAGYQPLEVNASDDRSTSVLQEKVLRAMESTTLTSNLTVNGKPNCIILDEVDGADAKTAISSLVDIIRADIPEKGLKQRQSPFLRRPIIFICNHKYAPALRPLLRYCQHFDVDPPTDQRLVARLRAVLSKERLSSNTSSLLNNLVVRSGGDIRSCLFTLQFAAAKARSMRATRDAIVDISSTLKGALGGDGLKDMRTDLASTVALVFKKPKRRENKPAASSIQEVLSVVESFGEHSKTMECIFNNLLSVSYVDPTMERCRLAHEWLSCGASMSSISSATAGAIHVLCRIETRPDLVLSNKESSNAHFQRESNMGILQKFSEGLKQSTCSTVITDTVPYVLWMLSATNLLHRPVSSIALLNKKELAAFDAHVLILQSMGLTYLQVGRAKSFSQQENEFALETQLELEIERLVHFKGYKVPTEHRRKRVPFVLRELLAHKANVETIRARDMTSRTPDANAATVKRRLPEPEREEAHIQLPRKSEGCDLNATSPSKKLKVDPILKNFLGIGAQKSKASRNERKKALVGFNNRDREEKLSHTGSGIPLTQVVRFKYQKGFTQAVRTVCRMEDLL